MIGRLIAASLTATCKFALCLFPVFPSAALWTALLSPDFQGAQSDPFFQFWRHGLSLLLLSHVGGRARLRPRRHPGLFLPGLPLLASRPIREPLK